MRAAGHVIGLSATPAETSLWRERLHRFFIGRSLGECLESRRDNILHLRLLAAWAVVMGHCSLGFVSQRPYDFVHTLLPATYMHVVGLMMFFAISGFLITYSFERRPDLIRFLRARALRIWPALVVCAIGVAFVLGPLLTPLPLRDYFSPSHPNNPYEYVFGSATIFGVRSYIMGLFETGSTSKVVNGPLWTIPIETTMYLWVAGGGFLRLYRFPWLASFAIAGVFAVVLLWPMMTGPFVTLNTKISLQGFFGAGVIAYLLRRHIPISTGLMLALVLVCVSMRHSIHTTPVIWLTVTYFVFWLAYVPRLPRIPGDIDLSYGTYLWGWPIQQAVVRMWNLHHPLEIFVATIVIAGAIAALSWTWIEKPALGLKDFRWPQRVVSPA